MSGLSQDQINVDLFNEVQRLKKEKQHDQEEIQRLKKENDSFRKAFHQFVNMKTVRTAPELVIQRYSRYAQELLEGRGMKGEAK